MIALSRGLAVGSRPLVVEPMYSCLEEQRTSLVTSKTTILRKWSESRLKTSKLSLLTRRGHCDNTWLQVTVKIINGIGT